MKNAVEILTAARAYIARGWCQGDFARDRHGISCDPGAKAACEWCAEGAVRAAVMWQGLDNTQTLLDAFDALEVAGDHAYSVENHNDEWISTQAEALAWFDRAIEVAA